MRRIWGDCESTKRSVCGVICQYARWFGFAMYTGVILQECRRICERIMTTGTLSSRTKQRTEKTMNDMSAHGNAVKNGLPDFKRLEALDILPLPICHKSEQIVDVEHASDYEFTAWLIWNGIPFTGEASWTFDSKCAVINHALRHGLKPRLIVAPNKSETSPIPDLFEYPKTAYEAD